MPHLSPFPWAFLTPMLWLVLMVIMYSIALTPLTLRRSRTFKPRTFMTKK